mmetsp:Transcript_22252/g.40441  ORF Transcript_22252/g.40441 Transcript_22252/m.40441 type:complete len:385 (+) Transcript_22252:121-1275(+)
MMAENETRAVSSATTACYLSTNRGENIKAYEILKGAKTIDVYIIHRGPDTKEAIVKPLASALNKLGVSTFSDTSPASMLPGDDNFVSMQHGLSGCRFAAVLLSETFLHSEHCVKEVNTMLKREQEEKKRLLIPFYYGISLDDSRFEVLKYRNALLKDPHEGARPYAIKMVKSILGKLERPIPSSKRLTNLFLDYDQSLREINGVLPSGPCQGKTKRRNIVALVVVVLLLTVAATVVAWQLLQPPETDPPFTNAPTPTVAPIVSPTAALTETTVDQSTALPTVQPVQPLTSCVVGERCNCGKGSDGATLYMEGFNGDDTALKVEGCGGEFGVNPSADGWERCCEICATNLQMEDQLSVGWQCETIYDNLFSAVPIGIMLKGVNKV